MGSNMSRRIFSFERPDRFVCGAIGQPGQRTFFLQASRGQQLVSVGLEKVQVAALAERLGMLLLGLREQGVAIEEATAEQVDASPLAEPIVEQFRVGSMTLAWDGDSEQVIIEARELTAGDDELEEPDDLAADGPDTVRVRLAPGVAHAFALRAVAVVQAGRPPCPQCGAPLDPAGHFCPRRNGFTH
jgi:uncharacterized repeat protein (TIGR03847 family)